MNFAKHDEKAPPPKTPSGTVAEAMLAKVTSKEQAKQLAKKADAAAHILGGLGWCRSCFLTGRSLLTVAAADPILNP